MFRVRVDQRLVSWTDAPDVTMGGGATEEVERLPDALADSDAVERFTTSYLVNGAVRLPNGSVLSLPDIIPVTVPDWHDRVVIPQFPISGMMLLAVATGILGLAVVLGLVVDASDPGLTPASGRISTLTKLIRTASALA